jgi:hypothetical protein
MFSTRTRLLAIGGGAVTCLLAITAAASASAGPPAATQVLLCGTTAAFAAYPQSGNSSIDHPTGLQAMGQEYEWQPGMDCENRGNAQSVGTFTWTVRQANVNVATERGNEHADASVTTLASTGSFANGFDGQLVDYDLQNSDGDPFACGNGAQSYYGSGHIGGFDSGCSGIGSLPGNFNTEGGAASGDHLNGKYGTLVYKDSNDTSCSSSGNSGTFCFEAIIVGRQN